jgi:hypothetical protein
VSERLSDEPLEPEFDPGLPRRRSEHGGMPRRDDDEFALAAERDRVAAGLEDYAPDDVPPAADPPPPGVSEAVDLAERGLLGDTSIDTPERSQQRCGFDGCDASVNTDHRGEVRHRAHLEPL